MDFYDESKSDSSNENNVYNYIPIDPEVFEELVYQRSNLDTAAEDLVELGFNKRAYKKTPTS